MAEQLAAILEAVENQPDAWIKVAKCDFDRFAEFAKTSAKVLHVSLALVEQLQCTTGASELVLVSVFLQITDLGQL